MKLRRRGRTNLANAKFLLLTVHLVFIVAVSSRPTQPDLAQFLLQQQQDRSVILDSGLNEPLDISTSRRAPKLDITKLRRERPWIIPENVSTVEREHRKTLLAIIHSSQHIGWPSRVELLVNCLISLEGDEVGGFEVVVILDSEGEHFDKNHCKFNALHVGIHHPTMINATGKELCDAAQLLREASIPFIIANKQKTLVRERKITVSRHLSLLEEQGPTSMGEKYHRKQQRKQHRQRQYAEDKKSPKAPAAMRIKSLRPLWSSAIDYAKQNGFTQLVTAISSSLLPSGVTKILADTADSTNSVVVPMFDSLALRSPSSSSYLASRSFSIPSLHLGSQHSDIMHALNMTSSLDMNGRDIPLALRQFAEHPLNYQRTMMAIKAAGEAPVGVDRGEFCTAVKAIHLVAAMPMLQWEVLRELGTPLDDCMAVQSALLSMRKVYDNSSLLMVHRGAYAVARPISRAEGLLENNPKPFAAAAAVGEITSNMVARRHQEHPKGKEQGTLVVITCAGVWPRTFSMLLSLDAGIKNRSPFSSFTSLRTTEEMDIMLAVTPRGTDTTAAFALAAGLRVLRQPAADGLTNLWNMALQYAMEQGYARIIIANNDLLLGSGSLSSLANALQESKSSSISVDVTLPATRHGAGAIDLECYSDTGAERGISDKVPHKVSLDDSFINSPLSFQRLQFALDRSLQPYEESTLRPIGKPIKSWMAFCFGLRMAWVRNSLMPDGSKRLFNDTRWKNYAQEKHLNDYAKGRPAKIVALRHAYVYHYRGGTLDSRNCKNGWLDCATWQQNHRPDMASKWWDPKKDGI